MTRNYLRDRRESSTESERGSSQKERVDNTVQYSVMRTAQFPLGFASRNCP